MKKRDDRIDIGRMGDLSLDSICRGTRADCQMKQPPRSRAIVTGREIIITFVPSRSRGTDPMLITIPASSYHNRPVRATNWQSN